MREVLHPSQLGTTRNAVPSQSHYDYSSTTRNRQASVVRCLLFLVISVVLIFMNDPHGLIRSYSNHNNHHPGGSSLTTGPPIPVTISQDRSTYPSILHHAPNATTLTKLGWLDAITFFQKEIAVVANQMHRETLNSDLNRTGFIDISPLQTLVSLAIDEVGVRGLFFHVFSSDNSDLVFFYDFPDQRHYCSRKMHGVTCPPEEPWWFYHFVGAITADKLSKEGKLLWDGSTHEYVEDMADLLHRVHLVQNSTNVGDFSFHAQHALEWQYVAHTMPDIVDYPVDLAQRFCGDFQHDNRKIVGVGKRIGYECYHGMGHAMFYLAALRQVSRMSTGMSMEQFGVAKQEMIMPQIQFRPNSGFELTQRSFCEIRRMCAEAPGVEETLPGPETCWGGVVHSIRLYTNRPVFYRKMNAMALLQQRFGRCKQDTRPFDEMDDVQGYDREELELQETMNQTKK
ncbi:hypothetical protein IV203_030596 [Nitzschia inconspicua]|uniref:Uncharacterized protein n=1 Tax=Nitzschia inconspicua TaxID=303405 RepID=A0A9K3K6S0_9STRA|nr:hypothetical protein IV203_017597 [Nitzschia inconspicua]KAG7367853.1 hypothetical protein IV203_030596 [Nitzschia inconspicua]